MTNLPSSVRTSLYRIATCFAMFGTLVCLTPLHAAAQLRKTKEATPRAIAVVQWPADNQGKAVPQLVPVIIRMDGKFFDASLYRATPRPMALEPGTVYEVQSKGVPIGYFTVERPLNGIKTWVAQGDWKPSELRRDYNDLSDRPQTAVVVRDRNLPDSPPGESVDDRDSTKKRKTVYDEQGREIPAGQEKDDDRLKNGSRPPLVIDPHPAPSGPAQGEDPDRPRIKRNPDGGQQTTTSTPATDSPQGSGTNDDPNRPRLSRNPSESPQAPTSTGSQAPAQNDDPDRPRMTRNPSGQSRPQTPAAQPKKAEEDPNRPRLKRGPQGERAEVAESNGQAEPVPERIRQFGMVSPLPKPSSFVDRTYEVVAVSDEADLKTDPIDFRYRAREEELKALEEKMVSLAVAELNKGATARPVASSQTTAKKTATKTRTAAPNSNAQLENVSFRAFDATGNNVAVLVLSAQREQEFVTVVARVDPDGNPRRLFGSHTRADRLDVTPRFALIDAVDGDADRRADLLFHVVTQADSGYGLYKIGPDTLQEMFRTR